MRARSLPEIAGLVRGSLHGVPPGKTRVRGASIDSRTIEPGDLLQGASGTDYSSVSITANASDPDYDLHWYAMRVWYDEDEEVSASMTGEYLEIWGDAGDGVCNTQAAVLRMQIGVTGEPPADTPFFWTVVVYDDQENPSEPVTQAFTTPSDPT